MVAVAIALVYFRYIYEYDTPEILLDCDLPTERPIMDAPKVIIPVINNTIDARIYASRYFPIFSNVDFFEEEQFSHGENTEYYGSTDNESLRVSKDGEIIYTVKEVEMSYVSEKDFPEEVARACSTVYIERHGGFGAYEETGAFPGMVFGDHGLEGIFDYSFEYQKNYSGYRIFGFDQLMVSVDPVGPRVIHFVRRDREYGVPNETRQVIPAQVAWWAARNTTNIDFVEDIKITNVELCYYFERGYNNITTVLCPAWRFSDAEISIFVNAFTGVVMD